MKWRQKLHLEPPEGWMNDPNGLSYYKGKYHIFFQYDKANPDGSGLKSWGHFAGESLNRLEFAGEPLRPDIPEDRSGVYSGSAIVYDGLLHIFYTGNVKEDGDFDFITAGRGANVIHVAYDGVQFGKKRVVLRNSDYPDYCTCHVRDPKVWREDGIFRMVLGARTRADKGCVLFFRSENLDQWEFDHALSSEEDVGFMWECPDLFDLDGGKFLSISPQGLPHGADRFQNVFQSGYFPLKDGRCNVSDFREWDMGFDFYAPQTFSAPDGRRLLIGWFGIADYENPTVKLGWQHCLTIPRQITRDGDALLQNPFSELAERRGKATQIHANAVVQAALPFDFEGTAEGKFSIAIDGVRLEYAEGMLTLRFTDSRISGGRTVRVCPLEKCGKVRIVADMSSLEIFADGGRAVMATRFYPETDSTEIVTEGINGTLWEITD